MTKITAFRERRGAFFGSTLASALAKDPNPDAFWPAAVQAESETGLRVCRYIANGYEPEGGLAF